MSPAAVDSQSLPETSSINGKAHISVHELDLESQRQSKRNGAGLLHYPKDLANAINPSLQVTVSHKLKLVPAPVREPAHGEVLIHVKATGICGSDIHFWKSGRIGSLEVDQDCILGHEAAGVVLRVGEGVTNVKQGDRIAIEPGVPCGNCFLCIEGRYNLCEDVHFAGVCPHDGSVQRYKCHPANWVHKMPDNLSFRQGALLEPLSVVMHGISMGKLCLGRGCAVHGAGPIGLIALAAARASGAHPIVITDIEPARLAFAKAFVPSCQTYLMVRKLNARENAIGIRRLFGAAHDIENEPNPNESFAPETVLECTGVESSLCTAAYVARRGGRIVGIGVGKSVMNNLPFMHLSLAEIELKLINRYHSTWPAAISVLSGGILNLDALVTHVFPLEKAIEAMEVVADVTKGGIKVQIVDDIDLD